MSFISISQRAERIDPSAIPPLNPQWWNLPGITLELNDHFDSRRSQGPSYMAVEAICNRLQHRLVVGTICIISTTQDEPWGGTQEEWAVHYKSPEYAAAKEVSNAECEAAKALAYRIADDPALLDTLDMPNLLDCRWIGRERVTADAAAHAGQQQAFVPAIASTTQAGHFTNDQLDMFADETIAKLDALGVVYHNNDEGVLLPDGSHRAIYSIEDTAGDGNEKRAFLGRRMTAEALAEVHERPVTFALLQHFMDNMTSLIDGATKRAGENVAVESVEAAA